MTVAGPLTLGTAGHIDHGKTALVRALTGVDTDRLTEERDRGISITLGYAALRLPSGRRLSLVDVPGHERFVRTMVAGASGIDLYLMVVAADDGVMPQTREHAAVLGALGVSAGVVAITKADVADPARAEREARELLPDAGAYVACSALTGAGAGDLGAALDRLAKTLPTRAHSPAGPLLHIDRAFSVAGLGTVVTGTLWSGTVSVGDQLTLMPAGTRVRVRGLQIHDEPHARADAGQRVAVNLAGVRARQVSRGDVLAVPGRVRATTVVDCALELAPDARHNERITLHHGTRDVPARLARLSETLWQLRLEKPVLAADGDRVVIRRLAPPDTLGGGTILDADATRHGRRAEVMARLSARAAGEPDPEPEPDPTPRVRPGAPDADPARLTELATFTELAATLRATGLALLNGEGADPAALAALCSAGQAVRVSGRLYADAQIAAEARATIVGLIEVNGSTSLGEVRDALGTGRKSAQALLEYLDAQRVTRRGPDERRVLRGRPATGSAR